MDWKKKYYEVAGNTYGKGGRPIVGLTANFGEYGSQIAEAYYESVRLSGGVPVVIPASEDVSDTEDLLQGLDAIVFTGGGDINPLLLGEEPALQLGGINRKRDVQELILMRRALDKQMPVLGICRGIQILCAATGGKLIQDIYSNKALAGPLLKHSQAADRDVPTHTVDLEEGTLLRRLFGRETLAVNSFHHQAVLEPGDGLRVSARSKDGVVEAVESTCGKSVLGVQWHPESFYHACGSDSYADNPDMPMKPIFDWLVKEAHEYKQARSIHKQILTLDTHCDTPMFFHLDIDFSKRDDRILVDSSKMRDGGLDATIMVAYLHQDARDAASLIAATKKADALLEGIETRIASAPGVALANTPEQLWQNKRAGLLSIMRGIENGYAVGLDITNVERFRKRGVVYMTLCHNGDNDICDSAVRSQKEHGGLSDFGREVVREMNRVGMMVDLSHGAATSFYDAMETSCVPIVCSHASCRALCDHPRNLDDDQLRALARNGGVMQVTLYPGFLRTDGHATIADALAHLDHAVEVMGIDHVGLGTDFDGDGGVPGLANASELINYTRALLRRRYSVEEIQMLWGGNFLRVMQQVQDYSLGQPNAR